MHSPKFTDDISFGKPIVTIDMKQVVPLKPDQSHAMFSLFLHKSLPTLSGERVVWIHRDKSTQFTELSNAQLQGCSKIGETHLCSFQHT